MERNPKRATRRVRAYFAAMKKAGHPIEDTVQEVCGLVGCTRKSVYDWKGGSATVSRAYAPAVEQAVDELRKKYKIV